MKNSTKQYLYSVLRQAWQELRVLGNKSAKVLMRTPLPRLLMLCIGVALLITIVPLVLTLFVIFMLVKLFLLLVVMNVRSQKTASDRTTSDKPQWSYKENEEAQLIRVEQIPYRRDDR
jgi:Flp pilus assembly protein TadB